MSNPLKSTGRIASKQDVGGYLTASFAPTPFGSRQRRTAEGYLQRLLWT